MRNVVDNHAKTRKFDWTDEATESFDLVHKAIVNNSPNLYFISENPNDKIYLHTDASDYGYGAYLYQTVGGREEHPILFMSKTFQGPELKWTVVR
eukprot:gene35975-46724_t